MMNLSMFARAKPVALLIPTTEVCPVKMIYVYLQENNRCDKQTELHARTDLKRAQLFLSHLCVLNSSMDSKEMGAILLLHIGIYPL